MLILDKVELSRLSIRGGGMTLPQQWECNRFAYSGSDLITWRMGL